MKARPSLFIRIAPLVAVLAIAIACTKAPNDAQVTSDIQSRMGTDSGLQNKQLTVQVANGTVTLSGTVDTDAQREAAARYAAAEPGVKQVINNLQVAPMSAAAEPAPAPEPTRVPEASSVKSSRSSRTSLASKAAHSRSTLLDDSSLRYSASGAPD